MEEWRSGEKDRGEGDREERRVGEKKRRGGYFVETSKHNKVLITSFAWATKNLHKGGYLMPFK